LKIPSGEPTKNVTSIRPRYIPLPSQDTPQSGRLILRDGTTAAIGVAQSSDQDAMRTFFLSLSAESKRRFFGSALPNDELIKSFCDPPNPRARLTLIVPA
jgi:hypothetical protein